MFTAFGNAVDRFFHGHKPQPLQLTLQPEELEPDKRSTREKASDGFKAALKNLEAKEVTLGIRIAADTHELHEVRMVIASLEQALDMLHDPLDLEKQSDK